jgi:hypothetical protein
MLEGKLVSCKGRDKGRKENNKEKTGIHKASFQDTGIDAWPLHLIMA